MSSVRSACPLCEGPSRPWLRSPDRHYDVDGEWEMHECTACGHRFQHPIPDESELAAYYPDTYYAHQPPEVDFGRYGVSNLGVWLELQALKRFSGYEQLAVSGALPLALAGRMLLRPLEFEAPPGSNGHAAKVLDYGSGTGSVVAFFRYIGLDAEGIELDADAAAAGRSAGLDITAGSIDVLEERRGRYDFITSAHCVEHVPDVERLFRAFHGALRPGGILSVEVPNGASDAANSYKEHYYHLALPVHVHLFTPGTLRSLAERAGFTDIRLAAYSRLKWHAESHAVAELERSAGSARFNDKRELGVRVRSQLRAVPAWLRSRRNLRGDCLLLYARTPPAPGTG